MNHRKLDTINAKLERIKDKASKTEKANKEEFAKIRGEMNSKFEELEDNVTEKVVDKLKPKIKEIQIQAKEDIDKAITNIPNLIQDKVRGIPDLIQEEVANAMKKYQEEAEDSGEEEDEE